MLTGFMGDLRFGIRMLQKQRIPSLVMIGTLALAVGANTALFSIVHQVLLSPLPFKHEAELYFLLQGPGRSAVSPRNYTDWKENSRLLRIAAVDSFHLTLNGKSNPRRLDALRTSHDFLDILGTPAALGRFFSPEEDTPGRSPVAVISSRLWRSEFSADPGVLGATLLLDGVAHIVIGVLSDRFEFPGETRGSRFDLIVPLALTDHQLAESQRGAQWISTIGRLTPGATVAQARQEMASIVEELRARSDRIPEDFEVAFVPFREMMVGQVQSALWALLAAVVMVLLVAVLNVAGLTLSQSTSRKGEFALRAALGASARRLSQQTLIESLLVAFAAGAIGVLLAFFARDLLLVLAPADVPRLRVVPLQPAVLLFSFLITAGAGMLSGLTPLGTARRVNLCIALADLQRSSRGSALTRRFGTALVAAEVALAVVILSSAGLLLRSLINLEQVNPGFDTENVLTFRLSLPSSSYDTTESVDRFYRDLRERLAHLPGVVEAGGIMQMPLGRSGNVNSSFNLEDVPEGADDRLANLRPVTPNYFSAMGIPMLAGRDFREGEDAAAPGVMIVNQTFVNRFLPDRQPLGQRVRPHVGLALRGRWATIVGIVGDVRHQGLDRAPTPEMYIPHSQSPVEDMTLVLKSRTPLDDLLGRIPELVGELDATLPVFDLGSLEEVRSSSLASNRFQAALFGAFALVALFLAAVGIFGLVSFRVSSQIPEIGIRRALGARNSRILLLVLGRAVGLAAIGLGFGLVGALWSGGALRSLLYRVEPNDPWTLAGLTLLVILATLLASLPPALRALRVAPLIALRKQ